ncbi:MAG: leucyl/phenylalanyl-tRNA--protein transferase [Chitinophagaceae bacterium]|nr:MAG: leucyl/phenylalanyl-tRNA--protein transferase [Chitinophagaceae bacterium]
MQLILNNKPFPNPFNTDEEGLAGISPNLDIDLMLKGYSAGFFPWFEIDSAFYWYCPPVRMVFDLTTETEPFSKSLKRTLNKNKFQMSVNRHFDKVLFHCADIPRKSQNGTWLSPRFKKVFIDLHEIGRAHSLEVYVENKLVGGLFGVSVGKFFSGESMFHLQTDASKVAFAYMTRILRKLGYDYIDCQLYSPHLKSLGAVGVSREEYLKMLKNALKEEVMLDEWKKMPKYES